MPKKGLIPSHNEENNFIIFKAPDDRTYTKIAYCHIHRANTEEHLKTIKLEIVGKKKIPYAKLSKDYFDVGEVCIDCDHENQFEFDIINTGELVVNYKIRCLYSAYANIRFSNMKGSIPVNEFETIQVSFTCRAFPPNGKLHEMFQIEIEDRVDKLNVSMAGKVKFQNLTADDFLRY